MSRRRGIRFAASGCLLLLVAGCDGEDRGDPELPVDEQSVRPVSQGQTWYASYNCAGCHGAGGGGGIGPPLNDGEWLYGSEPEHILASVIEGRPNGMPSFRGKIEEARLRQLVAFVRSLGGLPAKD